MPVWLRYCLFQIPELIAVGCVLAALVWFDLVAWYWAAAGFAVCVAKDAALYPWLRPAYTVQPSTMVGAERLLGARGVATEDLAPEGFVRVSSELWRARSADGTPVAKGAPVRVEAVHGLLLIISPAPDSP